MDAGLTLAVKAAGSQRRLAERLGVTQQAVQRWGRVPAGRLFQVAEATGVAAVRLRPDLAALVAERGREQRMQAMRAVLPVVEAAAPPCAERRALEDWGRDLLIALAAARFVAEARELTLPQLLTGTTRPEQAARARAMSLAVVAGRARASATAALYGVSRQAVDNAAERYLRARDGDAPEDLEADGRVLERGRLRDTKAADAALATEEARFTALIAPEPERRR